LRPAGFLPATLARPLPFRCLPFSEWPLSFFFDFRSAFAFIFSFSPASALASFSAFFSALRSALAFRRAFSARASARCFLRFFSQAAHLQPIGFR
jgi:hypothetical protein